MVLRKELTSSARPDDRVHQRRVEQADVIGRDNRALASRGQMLAAFHLQPQEGLEEKPGDVLHALPPGYRFACA